MTDDRLTVERETIQGIAKVLARDQGSTPAACWEKALSLWWVQFETEILPPSEPKDERSGHTRPAASTR
jgi:hypothetical protein